MKFRFNGRFKHLAMLDQTINIQNKSKFLNKKRISK